MFKTIIERFKAKTPSFFKRVVALCAIIGATGGTATVAGDSIPPKLHDIGTYMVATGIAGGFIAQLTKEDPKPAA